MANLLPVTGAAGNSADIVVAAGTPVTVSLFGWTGSPLPQRQLQAYIQIKDSAGGYATTDTLCFGEGTAAKQITAPGTYRIQKLQGDVVGVDQS